MTFAQFQRMKPKYKLRLIIALLVLFLIFLGLLWGFSAAVGFINQQINTTHLEDVTPSNLFLDSTAAKIQKAIGQDDPNALLVRDSRIVCNDQGGILEFEMNLVNLVSTKASDDWTIHLDKKKTYLRRTSMKNQNAASLSYRKIPFANYYSALARINAPEFLKKLQEEMPVGSGGHYIFTDQFDNNLEPQFQGYLAEDYLGYKVSKAGTVDPLVATYVVTPGECVPYILSVETVNVSKSKGNRVVLLQPAEAAVVLFDVGAYLQ